MKVPSVEPFMYALYVITALIALLGVAAIPLTIWKDRLQARIEREREERIAIANQHSAEANARAEIAVQRAEEARLRQKELEKENLALTERIEKEKQERLELEKAISPVLLNDNRSVAVLRQFSGVPAEIEFRANSDAGVAAAQIGHILTRATWNVIANAAAMGRPFEEGVVIVVNPKEKRHESAAIALAEQLHTDHVRTVVRLSENVALISISVGEKSTEYFRRRR